MFAGAHLDSVRAGPGLNDNGSGSAAVLENALAVARANLRPEKRLKFGWWGAEELGLIGSDYYASNLGSTERAKIDVYLNFDMVGQKDITTWGVHNHNDAINALFKEYFNAGHLYLQHQLERQGTAATHSTTFTLTINGTPPGTCAGYDNTFQGTLSSGSSDYQPDGSWFYTGSSGTHEACLDGPDGTDYDLYLQRWTGYGWSTVDRGISPGPDESFSYNGSAGYYRYRVHAYSGSGSYTRLRPTVVW